MTLDPTDTVLLDLLHKIERRGWAIVGVFGTDTHPSPAFSYTVGLTALGHPELILYGLPLQTAGVLLNDVGDRIKAGQQLRPGDRLDGILRNDLQLAVTAVTDTHALTSVYRVYGECDTALQLVWPDPDNRMPWEPGYTMDPEAQPVTGPTPPTAP